MLPRIHPITEVPALDRAGRRGRGHFRGRDLLDTEQSGRARLRRGGHGGEVEQFVELGSSVYVEDATYTPAI